MTWFTGIVMYVLIWWTALFIVLPFGTRPVSEADPTSGWRGAPAQPRPLRILLATTLLAAILWGGCYLLIASDLISFRHGWWAMPSD